jgi:hypothetical protein
VHAFGVLDQLEYEISFMKCERMDFRLWYHRSCC